MSNTFKVLSREATAEFDLVAMGPVLISDGSSNKQDPTLPDGTFLMGRCNTAGELSFVIPGSTIKGVIRNNSYDFPGVNETELFGLCSGQDLQKSKISFHDAYADMSTVTTNIRHSTAIEAHVQTAKNGSLNNMQVVEKGDFKASFRMVNFTDSELLAILSTLCNVNSGAVRFGGRKSRGFGFMNVKNFKLTVNNGYDEDFKAKDSKTYDGLDEAIYYFGKES